MAVVGYVDTTDFATWLSDRGYTLSGTDTQLLYQAFDYVEMQSFKGYRTDDTQDNAWPRTGVYIDGVSQDKDTVPNEVKELQMRVAYDIDNSVSPLTVRTQGVKSETVFGAVSVEYMDGSSTASVSRQTSLLLAKLTNGGGGNMIEVSRG